jgi:hypothetical protein
MTQTSYPDFDKVITKKYGFNVLIFRPSEIRITNNEKKHGIWMVMLSGHGEVWGWDFDKIEKYKISK